MVAVGGHITRIAMVMMMVMMMMMMMMMVMVIVLGRCGVFVGGWLVDVH